MMDNQKETENVLSFIEEAAILQARAMKQCGLLVNLDAFAGVEGKTAEGLHSTLDEMGNLLSEIRKTLKTESLLPIGPVFSRYRRVAESIALSLSRKIELISQGDGVMFESTTLDALRVSLTQLVRNAIALGFDSIETRLQLEKPEAMLLTLKAFQEDGFLSLQVENDGRGASVEEIYRQPDMEAVLANVKRLAGTLNITSQSGKGSSIVIRLPLFNPT